QPIPYGLPPHGPMVRRLCREPWKKWARKGAIRSVRDTRLDTAGNRGFSGASTMPGADVWRRSETSRGLEPDGWLVRRMGVDATGMKTRMRLRWPSGGEVCRTEHNGKKCQKLWKGEVLPLDRSLLMGDSSDASFQRVFIPISGLCSMKALYTQRVRTLISSKARTSASMAIGLTTPPPAPAPPPSGGARRSCP